MTELSDAIRARYGAAAAAVRDGSGGGCGCGPQCGCDPISGGLYSADEAAQVPAGALAASLGCGNPTAMLALEPGETVLDLGSGGGIDVLLAARRVGPDGRAYGVDMTDEMLALARQHQQTAGVTNAGFLKGTIEAVPLPDASVDVVISNCVINLSADKGAVLREAFRVLKPGGRLAISDVVSQRDVPASIRASMEHWIGCIAGALDVSDYRARLERAGFTDVSFEITREYRSDEAGGFLATAGIPVEDAIKADKAFASAFIRATRPGAREARAGS